MFSLERPFVWQLESSSSREVDNWPYMLELIPVTDPAERDSDFETLSK